MLIKTKVGGEPLIAPGDITEESARLLIESGDADEVTSVKLVTDVSFPDLRVKYKEGEVLDVTAEHERYFKAILSPRNRGTVFYGDLLD